MNITIIGLGTIGRTVLQSLSDEGHAITIIDSDKALVERLIERYDVFGVVGNGASLEIQNEARVPSADLVIAMTRNDELNILACLVAKNIGVRHTIARVRNPDYRLQIAEMKDDLGISLVMNPEWETAGEIFNLIDLPSVARIEHFAAGRVLLVEVVAEAGCALIGESLVSLGRRLRSRILICAVQRGEEVFIPSGGFVIQEGDRIHFTADKKSLSDFLAEAGLLRSPLRRVMILGGGKVGYYLADRLAEKRCAVKLIEKDPARAEELAAELSGVTVVQGNGTKHGLLLEEGIEAMDAFVALTGVDEENIIVSLFAAQQRVKKTITRVRSAELYGMLDALGIENTVSSRRIVAARVTSYVRALANSQGSRVLTLYRLVNDQVEALEFSAKGEEPFYGRPLRELTIRRGCLIACIIRRGNALIPNGDAEIRRGDNVVVVTTHKNFDDLSDVFEAGDGR